MAPRQRGMAAMAASATRGANLIEMGRPRVPSASLDAFCSDPRNHRENLGDLADLAARMRKHGQLQPVVCISAAAYRLKFPALAAEISYGADYVVVMGNRRLKAAPLAGLETLTYTLSDHLLEKDDYREAALDENWRREDLTCLDDARLLAEFLEVDGTHRKVAERVGKSEGFVAQRLRLLTLATEVQEAIDARLLAFRQVRPLCRLNPAEQLAELEVLLLQRDSEDEEPVAETAAEAAPRPPRQRSAPKPPTPQATGRILARFKTAHGTDAVAALVREEMDAEELASFVAATVSGLDSSALGSLVTRLSKLRDRQG